jgi:cell shape-determining protein MreC
MVSQLTAELLKLQQLNADRQMVGDIRQYCTPVRVVGTDPGKRESLALLSGTGQGIQAGQPVLALKGLVGKVHSSGLAGSQVMLVTDREFSAIGEFRRFERNAQSGAARYVATGATPPVVKGAGDGLMTITNVPLKETAAGKNDMPDIEPVRVGDLVVLNDDEWPYAHGRWLGHVESIEALKSAPLFAQITVRPALNLPALREVLVMTRTPHDGPAPPDESARTAESVLTPGQ